VGQRTDYEKLILEVQTDGSIQPDEAVSMAGKIIAEHVSLFTKFAPSTEEEIDEQDTQQDDAEFERIRNLLMTRMEDIELSCVHTTACVQQRLKHSVSW
jgi:DNA-directed RNA polymerase subunit alpha